jgi:hypothetical protein
MKKFFVQGRSSDGVIGFGDSPNDAYNDYQFVDGRDSVGDCCFYEAEKIEVAIVKKETVIKTPVTILNSKDKGTKK